MTHFLNNLQSSNSVEMLFPFYTDQNLSHLTKETKCSTENMDFHKSLFEQSLMQIRFLRDWEEE